MSDACLRGADAEHQWPVRQALLLLVRCMRFQLVLEVEEYRQVEVIDSSPAQGAVVPLRGDEMCSITILGASATVRSPPREVILLLPAVVPKAFAQVLAYLDPAIGLCNDIFRVTAALSQQRAFCCPFCRTLGRTSMSGCKVSRAGSCLSFRRVGRHQANLRSLQR